MLGNVIKRTKKFQLTAKFVETLGGQVHGVLEEEFQNYRDEDIPKHFSLTISEGITVLLSNPNRDLKHLMRVEGDEERLEAKLTNFKLDLLYRTFQESYFLSINSSKAYLSTNGE